MKYIFRKYGTTNQFKQKITENIEYRHNEMNIQMLSSNLHKQIFGTKDQKTTVGSDLSKLKMDLKTHGININSTPNLPDIDLLLPILQGKDIVEHFYNIANEQCEPYEKLIKSVLCALPEKPKNWLNTPGWTCYEPNKDPYSVPFPDETALIFDVEICMARGKAPTLATAVGSKCWYSWTSSCLHKEVDSNTSNQFHGTDELIPMESDETNKGYDLDSSFRKPKIIIGHNVSFDRARIKEQYWIESTATRFLDTMSLHVCVSGMTSYQRAMMMSSQELSEIDHKWSSQTSLNSLAEVHKLYCGTKLDKNKRNVFIDGTLEDIKNDFNNLVEYCANDVIATHNVLCKLFPLFKKRFSHPVTLAGMLEIGNAYLPINSNWNRYIDEANLSYEDLKMEQQYHLSKRADQLCRLLHNNEYKKHLWMWDQDWSIQNFKLNKFKKSSALLIAEDNSKITEEITDDLTRLSIKFKYFEEQKKIIPKRRPLLPGYPAWYRKLCSQPNIENWSLGTQNIGTGMQITPKLLSLCWEGYPLHYLKNKGWGFLVPFLKDNNVPHDDFPYVELLKKCPIKEMNQSSVEELIDEGEFYSNTKMTRNKQKKRLQQKEDITSEPVDYSGSGHWCNEIVEYSAFFYKLPHKDGISKNVGNPLAKDFLIKFSQHVLSGNGPIAERIMEIASNISYWRNNKERIMGQMIVWLAKNNLPNEMNEIRKLFGSILPQIVVCGTLTRRAMEPTWLTASNAQLERVGSELRSMVQSPPGYKLIGADVDSQELWIASVLGDAQATGIHGATPLGWMTLNGTKTSGTDMHSITAKAIGISRDHAKIINYSRIYGAGIRFAERLLKQFNPSFSDSEAKLKAQKMFLLTKGQRVFYLRDEFKNGLLNIGYTRSEAFKLARELDLSTKEIFKKSVWEGGTESAMFNRLEEIASSKEPVTPFLKCHLSRAVESNDEYDDRFLPTRINWVVQSGAVDFLHLMLVCMRWLMNDKTRFCLSFHDEVRYLVKDEYAYKSALAMHVTNLLTRSFCVKSIEMNDLPQSIAFFTSVEVDTVLRKEAQMDCKTPSNPHGLSVGYGINPGESLDIHLAIKKANGNNLRDWEWHRKPQQN